MAAHAWQATALLLADARAPVGGNVNSAGLEPALRGGMPSADVPGFLRTRLRIAAAVEGGVAVVARHLFLQGEAVGIAGPISRIQSEWAARSPSAAQRDASRLLARGYARLAHRLWPSAALTAATAARGGASRGLVLGAIAATTAMPAEDTVRLVMYDDAQAVASALLKLRPMDPADAAAWVLDACADAEPLVRLIATIEDPADIPAAGAPLMEEWTHAHASLTERLFRV